MYIFKMASEEERSRNIKDLIHRALILGISELTNESRRLIAQTKKLVDEMRSLRAKIKSQKSNWAKSTPKHSRKEATSNLSFVQPHVQPKQADHNKGDDYHT